MNRGLRIIELVSGVTEIPVADIIGPCRRAEISEARHLAAWLMREGGDMTLREIGRELNRDHSTVVHSLHVVKAGYDRYRPLILMVGERAHGT